VHAKTCRYGRSTAGASNGYAGKCQLLAKPAGLPLPKNLRVRYDLRPVAGYYFGKKRAVYLRRFFVCGVLLLFASGAFGGRAYQRTRDGKTLVWNSYPRPADAVTWSGDRDQDRYASGQGTLVLYRIERTFLTGSSLPSARYVALGRYSGKMVRGKLDGPVNVEVDGETFHAAFADGKKTGRWATGPAPTANEQRVEDVQPNAVVEAPAEGPPPPTQAASPPATAKSSPTATPARTTNQPVSGRAVKEAPNEIDDSLRELVGPPSSLRINPAAAASPQTKSSPSPAAVDPANRTEPEAKPSPTAEPDR
jgi:hypothetical protein